MRRGIPLLIVISAITFTPLLSKPTVVSDSGVEMQVQELQDPKKVPAFYLFQIEGKNSTDKPKTVHGEITLTDNKESNRCIVYLEIPPGQTRIDQIRCKGGKNLGSWKFEIVKIWDFILS